MKLPRCPLDLNVSLDQLFDGSKLGSLIACAKGDRRSRRTRSSRTADSVHVDLGNVGEVDVEDMRDAVDVQASRRDIRRHQHRDPPRLELVEYSLTLGLALVAMDCRGKETGTLEIPHHLVGAVLRSREGESTISGQVS